MGVWIEDIDSLPTAVAKGLMLGGLATSSLYGLSKLKDLLIGSFTPKVEVFPSKELGFKKKSENNDTWGQAFDKRFLYGAAVPLGAYAVYKLVDHLSDVQEKYDLISKLREYEHTLSNTPYDKKMYKVSSDLSKDAELNKMVADKELLADLDGYFDKIAELTLKKFAEDPPPKNPIVVPPSIPGQIINGAIDLGTTLLADIPPKLPYIYGALFTLGALGGYKGMEHLMTRNMGRKVNDPLNPPQLVYKFQKE